LTDVSEYGEIVGPVLDEWGRQRTDSLLEDGVKILVAVAAPIVKTWSQTGIISHVYSRPFRNMELTQTLSLAHTFVHHRFIQLTQALQTHHTWTVEYPALILKQWFATLQTTHVFSRSARRIKLPIGLRLFHAYFVALPTIKKTKLFLVIGDLAIQLSRD